MAPRRISVAAVNDCFNDLLAAKSAHTKRAYAGDMRDYHDWAGGENWADAIFDLVLRGRVAARKRMNRYQSARLKTDAQATVRRRIAAIQTLVAQLRRENYIDWNLEVDPDTSATKETRRATAQRDMSGPTPGEMKKLRSSLAADGSLAGLRDRAIIALLENPMLREHEVEALTRGDIDLARRRVQILGKGRQETEFLPLPASTCEEVRAWIEAADIRRGTPLFRQIIRSKRKLMKSAWRQIGGQWLTPDKLSTASLYQVCRSRGKAAGLTRPLRPHGLRHTGITVLVNDCVKNGIPLTEAQKITRHKKLETLMGYVDRQGERAAEILERTSRATR